MRAFRLPWRFFLMNNFNQFVMAFLRVLDLKSFPSRRSPGRTTTGARGIHGRIAWIGGKTIGATTKRTMAQRNQNYIMPKKKERSVVLKKPKHSLRSVHGRRLIVLLSLRERIVDSELQWVSQKALERVMDASYVEATMDGETALIGTVLLPDRRALESRTIGWRMTRSMLCKKGKERESQGFRKEITTTSRSSTTWKVRAMAEKGSPRGRWRARTKAPSTPMLFHGRITIPLDLSLRRWNFQRNFRPTLRRWVAIPPESIWACWILELRVVLDQNRHWSWWFSLFWPSWPSIWKRGQDLDSEAADGERLSVQDHDSV